VSYKIINEDCILRLHDNCVFPVNQFNSDYIRYQEWLEDGNEPEPADPLPPPPPNWTIFYDQLLVSEVFQVARSAAKTSLEANLAYVDLANSLSLAKQGSINLPALQTCFDDIFKVVTLSDQNKQELEALFEANYLTGTITLNY
jgi:hypothetical protein